jgi:hypothetical protein
MSEANKGAIFLTGGEPSTSKEAAYHILLILGCTGESGGVFQDDLDTVTTIIADLVTPGKRAEQLLRAYVAEEISIGRLRECITLWSEANDFALPGDAAP